jgi:hypothetical protein
MEVERLRAPFRVGAPVNHNTAAPITATPAVASPTFAISASNGTARASMSIAANEARMTQVSIAEPPASRHLIGTRLYAENVACAADRV